MSDGVALYYPHIEFRSPDWLKWALLFWDNGIRRIVPGGTNPYDNDEIVLAQEKGAIINTDSSPYLDLAATEFLTHLDSYKQLMMHEAQKNSSDGAYPVANEYVTPVWDLRASKIRPDVEQRLLDEGLATLEDHWQDGKILRVTPALAATYMTILARKMSEGTMPIVTDRPRYLRLANEVIGGTIAQDVPESSNVLQNVLVDFIDPERVSQASMTEILEIREKLLPYMKAFRTEIEASVAELSATTSVVVYENKIKDVHSRIDDAVQRYKREAHKYNLEFIAKALGASGLSLLPAAATTLGYALTPATGGASIVASFVLTALLFRQGRAVARDSNKFQYVISLKSALG